MVKARNEPLVDMGEVTVTKTVEVGMVFLDFYGKGVKLGQIELIRDGGKVTATWYPEGPIEGESEVLFWVKES